MPDGAGSIAVLVVDDHAMVAEAIVSTLGEQPDMRVVGLAHTVGDALVAAAGTRPDVVVMDYRLPDGDGIDATRRLRAECPQAVVVLLTGFADDATFLRALEAGCVGMVAKEHSVDELVAAVRAAAVGLPVGQRSTQKSGTDRVAPRPPFDLTVREREVLQLLADGVSTDAIARRLVLSLHTVRNHIRNVLGKMGAHSRLEAVSLAMQHGIVTLRRPPV
jgi:DNA-binding NarL/FixJ family response regulator